MTSDPMTDAQRHVPRLVGAPQIHTLVHGAGALGRFNAAMAVRITDRKSTRLNSSHRH